MLEWVRDARELGWAEGIRQAIVLVPEREARSATATPEFVKQDSAWRPTVESMIRRFEEGRAVEVGVPRLLHRT